MNESGLELFARIAGYVVLAVYACLLLAQLKRFFVTALRQPPRLNLCASARRPRFFNNGKRAAPAAAAESLRVGAPAAFFNNGKPALRASAAKFF